MKGGGILFWVVREQLNEKVTSGQRPGGGRECIMKIKGGGGPEVRAWLGVSQACSARRAGGWRVLSKGDRTKNGNESKWRLGSNN